MGTTNIHATGILGEIWRVSTMSILLMKASMLNIAGQDVALS